MDLITKGHLKLVYNRPIRFNFLLVTLRRYSKSFVLYPPFFCKRKWFSLNHQPRRLLDCFLSICLLYCFKWVRAPSTWLFVEWLVDLNHQIYSRNILPLWSSLLFTTLWLLFVQVPLFSFNVFQKYPETDTLKSRFIFTRERKDWHLEGFSRKYHRN